MKLIMENWRQFLEEEKEIDKPDLDEGGNFFDNMRKKRARGEPAAKPGDKDYPTEKAWKNITTENEAALEEKKGKSSRCTKVTKKTSSTRKGKKWMKCVKSDSGGYKRIHWGQAGVRVTGKSGNTARKRSFKKRHGCSSAKSNTHRGQACKDWAEE